MTSGPESSAISVAGRTNYVFLDAIRGDVNLYRPGVL